MPLENHQDHQKTFPPRPEDSRGRRPNVQALDNLLRECDEAERSLSNVIAMLELVATGRDQITDPRRLAVFCRLMRSAEHELEAATRQRAASAS